MQCINNMSNTLAILYSKKLNEERQSVIPKLTNLENEVSFLKRQSLPIVVDKFSSQIEALEGKITALGTLSYNVSERKSKLTI